MNKKQIEIALAKTARKNGVTKEEIAQTINREAKRGITAIYGKGMYTGNSKTILLCVTSRGESIKIRNIIEKIDPEVFLIITNAREVFGKGFK